MNRSSHFLFFLTGCVTLLPPLNVFTEVTEQAVEDLKVEAIDSGFSRLTWKPFSSEQCREAVRYSVFRGNQGEFSRSIANQIASKVTSTTFIARVLNPRHAYFYQVIAVPEADQCSVARDARAQALLGDAYYYGRKLPRDYIQAAVWYRKAAELGDSRAQVRLGYLYRFGQGVAKDDSEAAHWFEEASIDGNASAQDELAQMYLSGTGVARNIAQAVRWYTRAAEQGDALGQSNLGVLYHEGDGVPQNYSESFQWFRMAAGQNYPEAMINLGEMYAAGQGVSQDYVQALFWMEAGLSLISDSEKQKRLVQIAQDRDRAASHLNSDTLSETRVREKKWLKEHASGAEHFRTTQVP